MPSYSRPKPQTAVKRPRDLRPIYTRFVCFEVIEGQRYNLGLFQAMNQARHSDNAQPWALEVMKDIGGWFNDHLDEPTCFELPLKRGAQAEICWFKPNANDHIQNMHDLKNALEACGVHVDVLTTRDVGQILYEDDHQVAAIPNRHTF